MHAACEDRAHTRLLASSLVGHRLSALPFAVREHLEVGGVPLHEVALDGARLDKGEMGRSKRFP